MIAYIPKADCQNLFPEATQALKERGLEIEIVSIPDYDEDKKGIRNKYIMDCYNLIFRMAEKRDDEFFLLINRDIVLQRNELDLMLKFITENPEFGLVSYDPWIRKREVSPMTTTGLCIIRKQAISGLVLEYNGEECVSLLTSRALRHPKDGRKNWKLGYVGEALEGKMEPDEMRRQNLCIKYLE
jgi:hypothetical protein